MSRLFKMALLNGAQEAVRLHLRRESVNARDQHGRTPIMIAAMRGRADLCALLLAEGADGSLLDSSGANAASLALETGCDEAAAILNQHAASLLESSPVPSAPANGATREIHADWEPEPEPTLAATDSAYVQSAERLHTHLSGHVPADHDVDWSDVAVTLADPTLVVPSFLQYLDTLRSLISYGMKSGRVNVHQARHACQDSEHLFFALMTALGDLGILVDDTLQQPCPPVPRDEESDWEDDDLVDEALGWLQNFLEQPTQARRLYEKDVHSQPLLTRQEELALASTMDHQRTRVLREIAGDGGVLRALLTDGAGVPRPSGEGADEDEDEPEDEDAAYAHSGDLDDGSPAGAGVPRATTLSRLADPQALVATDGITTEAGEHLLRELHPPFTVIRDACGAAAVCNGTVPRTMGLAASMEQLASTRERFVLANLRLVLWVARKYSSQDVPVEDLVQEGNIGLFKAVERFDHRREARFSTYAVWWIRQAITRAIADQARTVRLPVHVVDTINKLTRVEQRLMQELGRQPLPEEIAHEMGIDEHRVREVQKLAQQSVSLETRMREEDSQLETRMGEDDGQLGDTIPDEESLPPGEAVSAALLKEQVARVLGTLANREGEVLRLRYGLDDGTGRTLEEVGRVFGVTRERIRQIEAKALRRLRHPSRSKLLRDFILG